MSKAKSHIERMVDLIGDTIDKKQSVVDDCNREGGLVGRVTANFVGMNIQDLQIIRQDLLFVLEMLEAEND